jgi:low temperature requirement protein LtrA
MAIRNRTPVTTLGEGARVSSIELFLDLVFVYGFTQVTELMAGEASLLGLVHGMVTLALLWWLWVGFSWLGNIIQVDEGFIRGALFLVMALVFIIDTTIPEAFHDKPGGLYAPWVFAITFLLVQVIHVSLMLLAGREIPGIRRNTLLLLVPATLCFGLLMVAGTTSGWAQAGLWAGTLVIQVGAVFVINPEGWQLSAASHFAERHGLIIIIALGESIVAIGVGVSQLPVSWPIIVASVLGIAVCATLWWAYFDVVAIVAEDVLHRAPDNVKPRLARDSYTFLHLPMIAGIILMALGQKKVFAHLGEHLPVEAIAVLYGGVSLYLWAHVAFRLRNIRTVNVQRTVVATLLLVLIPVCAKISALSALAVLTVIMVGLIAYEARHFAELRYRIRHGETSARP